MTETGKIAPEFTLPQAGGGEITLSQLRPMRVVLYFYPKDDTSGCTLEAQDFNARLAEFEAAGAVVIGVSKDSIARHDRFRDKYDLAVTLVSDGDGDTCEHYGVRVRKIAVWQKVFRHRAVHISDRRARPDHPGLAPGAGQRPCRRGAGIIASPVARAAAGRNHQHRSAKYRLYSSISGGYPPRRSKILAARARSLYALSGTDVIWGRIRRRTGDMKWGRWCDFWTIQKSSRRVRTRLSAATAVPAIRQ